MRCRRIGLILLGAGSVIVGGAAVAQIGGYRLNLTPSEPLGLWRINALHRPVAVGDLVFICPPPTALFESARRRGYLRAGLCSGGFAPLIKTIVALPGQHVEVGRDLAIDGHPLASSSIRTTDAEGRPLDHYRGGVVPSGYLFLHSAFASSYDSRYFGPVPDAGLLGLARPVFTFDP
ncbi:conjugative transfer signal peptidase TraF [Rhizobium sp. CNPSo 3464]|uniref:conjugative transfer signal peptidase TraF n=1 Tax=Rhizobium sp. CNPSo 3464 TaxID=3021406 RepID=UPI000DD5EFD0|nr:conjugative transfer signal peptidase TraF [Rhizobium sp. CNPSo 3464]MDK4742554.1 conjugative transfer signal peptidase TraF [Rhizobium sp. CNPSo 3464]